MGTFHVVCHECPEEGIYDARAAALEARDEHESETGHAVSFEDISCAVTNP